MRGFTGLQMCPATLAARVFRTALDVGAGAETDARSWSSLSLTKSPVHIQDVSSGLHLPEQGRWSPPLAG